MAYERLQRMYSGEGFYWGKEPNVFARRTLNLLPKGSRRALDLGAGEGRDAVFFAENGLEVLAVDISENALDKAKKLAAERNVALRTEPADLNDLRLAGTFDLVYSIGTVQYVEPSRRRRFFDFLKERTSPGGLNAVFTFVDDPDVPPAPDLEEDEFLFAPGELAGYYEGWETLYGRSFVFDDDSGNVLHRHAAEEYVFKKTFRT